MKTNDPYFQAFDKEIKYNSETAQIMKLKMTKLDTISLLLPPLLITVVSVFVLKNTLATLLSGFVWLYFIYVYIAVYSNGWDKF